MVPQVDLINTGARAVGQLVVHGINGLLVRPKMKQTSGLSSARIPTLLCIPGNRYIMNLERLGNLTSLVDGAVELDHVNPSWIAGGVW